MSNADEIAKRISRPQRRTASTTQAQGTRDFPVRTGYVWDNERHAKLRRHLKYRTFSEMVADHPLISASMDLFLSTIQKTKWTFEPIEDDPDSRRYADGLDEIVRNMDIKLPQVMRRAAMYRYYGFGIQEWIAKKLDSGLIGFKAIEPRGQHTIHRWDISERGEILGVEQYGSEEGRWLYIDRRRMIYCVDDSIHDSPEGLGVFRKLFTTTTRLDAYLMLEEIGFDTDLRGMPIIKAPLGRLAKMVTDGQLKQPEADAIKQVFLDFINEHQKKKSQGMLIDSEPFSDSEGNPSNEPQYSVELMRGDTGSVHADLATAIQRERSNLALVLSSAFLLLGQDGAGSLALSRIQIEVFIRSVEAVLEYLSSVFERDFIKRAAELNGWDESKLPEMVFEAPKMQDILEITEALRNMATAGGPLHQEDPVFDELRAMMGLCKRPEDLEFPTPMGMDPDLNPRADGSKNPAAHEGKKEEVDDGNNNARG